MIIQNCKLCKNEFKVSNYRIGIAKFCSRKCANNVTKNNKGKLSGQIFNCQICDSKFYRPLSNIKKGINKYCSSKCWGRYMEFLFSDKTQHYNWQGGKTAYLTQLRHSKEYEEWRIKVFKRDNFTCQFCGIYGKAINADHIKPWILYPELRFDLNNGRTLCKPCHRKTDTYGGRVWKTRPVLSAMA